MVYLLENIPEFLLILGLLLLVIEVLVLGFSTFFLFFLGIGAISTALIFFAGAIEATVFNALISVAVISCLSTAFLWKPLQSMQELKEQGPAQSDLIGLKFYLQARLNVGEQITHQYSGIHWKLTSAENLEQGQEVEVIEVSVGRMRVKSVNTQAKED